MHSNKNYNFLFLLQTVAARIVPFKDILMSYADYMGYLYRMYEMNGHI